MRRPWLSGEDSPRLDRGCARGSLPQARQLGCRTAAPMPNFLRIAVGLDVPPALAELARQPEYWLALNADDTRIILLLGADAARLLEAELTEVWRLIERVRAILAADHGDRGALTHARVGLMPPGSGLAPHFDGLGANERRYQLALQSQPGVALTVGGEVKYPRPGDVWRIDASRVHSIRNDSAADRITILLDTRERASSVSRP